MRLEIDLLASASASAVVVVEEEEEEEEEEEQAQAQVGALPRLMQRGQDCESFWFSGLDEEFNHSQLTQ